MFCWTPSWRAVIDPRVQVGHPEDLGLQQNGLSLLHFDRRRRNIKRVDSGQLERSREADRHPAGLVASR